MVDTPPNQDPLMATADRPWAPREHVPNYTLTRGAYKPYNTCVSPAAIPLRFFFPKVYTRPYYM